MQNAVMVRESKYYYAWLIKFGIILVYIGHEVNYLLLEIKNCELVLYRRPI